MYLKHAYICVINICVCVIIDRELIDCYCYFVDQHNYYILNFILTSTNKRTCHPSSNKSFYVANGDITEKHN